MLCFSLYIYIYLFNRLEFIIRKGNQNSSKKYLDVSFLTQDALSQECSQCGAVLGIFSTMQCGLAKTITVPHLIFAVTYVVRCDLEFSQNHNRTAPHFCGHMCDVVYKMRFEINIFFKFWVFPSKPKTNFCFCFGPSFKLLS